MAVNCHCSEVAVVKRFKQEYYFVDCLPGQKIIHREVAIVETWSIVEVRL